MRNKKILIIALTFLLLFSVPGFALDYLYPPKVERVIDGDTIVVDLYLGLGVILDDQYIRFYGIDTWEIRGEEREKGLEAKEYLEERLSKGKIEIRPEFGNQRKGKYGRWLGILFVSGININRELIEEGLAVEYQE